MSGVHKYPTISFRISPRERDEIEAKIKASGMQKKDYFVRSCIYNKVCVVGKKEVIYQLVEELQLMQYNIAEILKQFEEQEMAFNVVFHVVKTNKKNGSKIAKDSVSWLYFGSNNLVREKYQIKFREYE